MTSRRIVGEVQWKDGAVYPILKASFGAAQAATTSLIAAPGAKFKLVILDVHMEVELNSGVQFLSASTPITGVFNGVNGMGRAPFDFSKGGLECAENEAFQVVRTLGAIIQGGVVEYIKVAV